MVVQMTNDTSCSKSSSEECVSTKTSCKCPASQGEAFDSLHRFAEPWEKSIGEKLRHYQTQVKKCAIPSISAPHDEFVSMMKEIERDPEVSKIGDVLLTALPNLGTVFLLTANVPTNETEAATMAEDGIRKIVNFCRLFSNNPSEGVFHHQYLNEVVQTMMDVVCANTFLQKKPIGEQVREILNECQAVRGSGGSTFAWNGFGAGTPILVPDKNKPHQRNSVSISSLKVGDLVLTRSADGNVESKRVAFVGSCIVENAYEYALMRDGKVAAKIVTSQTQKMFTGEIFEELGQSAKIPKDAFPMPTSATRADETLIQMTKVVPQCRLFQIEVEDNHNYLVTDLAVVTHNDFLPNFLFTLAVTILLGTTTILLFSGLGSGVYMLSGSQTQLVLLFQLVADILLWWSQYTRSRDRAVVAAVVGTFLGAAVGGLALTILLPEVLVATAVGGVIAGASAAAATAAALASQ